MTARGCSRQLALQLALLCAPGVRASRGPPADDGGAPGAEEPPPPLLGADAWLCGHGPPSCPVFHGGGRPDALRPGPNGEGGEGGADRDRRRRAAAVARVAACAGAAAREAVARGEQPPVGVASADGNAVFAFVVAGGADDNPHWRRLDKNYA